MRILSLIVALLSSARAVGAEIDKSPMDRPEWELREGRRLRNIRQLTFGGEKTGECYFSPDGTKIIFQRVPEGQKQYQMYVQDLAAGAQPKLVSTGKGACTCGHFRPDGKKIIWASTHDDPDVVAGKTPAEEKVPGYQKEGRSYRWAYPRHMNIYESDPDGSNRRALTSGPFYTAEGSYSPDGNWIVYASDREGDIELYVMDADGKTHRRVTNSKGYDGGPFFSPEGKRILWRSDRKSKDLLQVFVCNVDGTGEKPLTDNGFVNWGPTFHPDGRRIIFGSSMASPPGKHTYDLWLVNDDGDMLERITYHPGPDILPVFSPDGKRLMWTSRRGNDPKTQIYIADWVE
jgi:Tol biopolymer transport system component